jgi:sulfonate transport system permease protein
MFDSSRPSGSIMALRTAVVVLALLVGAWSVGAAATNRSGAIPWPADVLAWPDKKPAATLRLWQAVGETLLHWVLAFAVAGAAAFLLGVAAWWIPSLRRILLAALLALRGTPLLLVIPIIASFFGRNAGVAVTAGVLTSLLPALTTILVRLDRVPDRLVEMAHVVAARWTTKTRLLVIPYAASGLRSSLRLIAPLALTGVIFAEWLATGDGLGTYVITAFARFDMAGSWAAAIVVVVLACLSSVVFGWLGDRSTPPVTLPGRTPGQRRPGVAGELTEQPVNQLRQ